MSKFKFGDIVVDRGRTKLRTSRSVVLSSKIINEQIYYDVINLETTRGGTVGGWYQPPEAQLELAIRTNNGWEPKGE